MGGKRKKRKEKKSKKKKKKSEWKGITTIDHPMKLFKISLFPSSWTSPLGMNPWIRSYPFLTACDLEGYPFRERISQADQAS